MANRIRVLGFLFVVTCMATMTYGQTGTISGKINDEQTGEEIVGANVLVVGTKFGASTDLDGRFTVKNVPAGTYDLRVSFIGYTSKTVTGVSLNAGETKTLNVNIVYATVQADEVIVTAERVLATESALLAERKKSATIGDGVSAEQIKKSPDATSGDALKRVTGISIVDNKFVFIRGITDRYNGTTLDGASVASTESGKKGFSFDLLPSNLLENTTVVKSATPDLPGDFTGGLVQMNTLDFPSRRVLKLSFSTSYNTLTTSKGVLSSQGGSHDWLGFDNGSRELPAVQGNGVDLAKALPNNWAPKHKRAPYNGSLSLSLGDQISFSDETNSDQLGYIAAISYSNRFQKNEVEIDEQTSGGSVLRQISGTQDKYSVLWGIIANVSYKFSGVHKLGFKSNYNQSAGDEVGRVAGIDGNIGSEVIFNTLRWTERSVYTSQLTGEHIFPEFGALAIQWRGGISTAKRSDPDRKLLPYTRQLGSGPSDPFTVTTSDRSWENLNDRSRSFGADFSLPIKGVKFKTGFFAEGKDTDYRIRAYRVEGLGADFSLFSLPIENVYAQQNFGQTGFKFSENPSNSASNYEANSTLYSGYVMADAPFEVFDTRVRFVGGARMENSTQNMFTTIAPGDPTPEAVQLKKNDVLPSANFMAIINDVTNIRLAYSHTVNRPEFRELASVAYYDFERLETVYGNPRLQRALVRNYDVRVEFFPQIGEVLAVSYFNKQISNPIEQVYQNSSTPIRTWFNSDHATNFGWELEFRKSLDFVGAYMSNFAVMGNYTRIESKVEVPAQPGIVGAGSERPLQGQSPYVINVSLLFTEPNWGTAVSFLYNKFGRRLDAVGGQNEPDVYEEARDLIDLSITQQLWWGLEGKFTVKNLTGKKEVLTKRDQFFRSNATGTTFGLSLSKSL